MITGGSHAVDILRFLHGEIDEVNAYSVRKREDLTIQRHILLLFVMLMEQ